MSAKVAAGFVSFTEVEAGHHGSYNQWHLFDHLPEQLPLPGIVWGERWVLTPALREHLVAEAPLDRVHYVTLYLLAEPLDATIADFMALAGDLRTLGRFHEHRIAHLAGPVLVSATEASRRALVSAAAVPYRPNRGVHVRVDPVGSAPDPALLVAVDGVAGAWAFAADPARSPAALQGAVVTWCWLDGDPATLAAPLAGLGGSPRVAATLERVDPEGPWDWFDR